MLDPLLAPALQLAELPVVAGREWADNSAHNLVRELEAIAKRAAGETDAQASGQLENITTAIGVVVISLTAYSRGRTPRVRSQEPSGNLVLPS